MRIFQRFCGGLWTCSSPANHFEGLQICIGLARDGYDAGPLENRASHRRVSRNPVRDLCLSRQKIFLKNRQRSSCGSAACHYGSDKQERRSFDFWKPCGENYAQMCFAGELQVHKPPQNRWKCKVRDLKPSEHPEGAARNRGVRAGENGRILTISGQEIHLRAHLSRI